MNICSFFSLFAKTARSHTKRHNVQCKRLCYFRTAAPSPHDVVLLADTHLPIGAAAHVLVLKWGVEKGHVWESIIYKIWSMSPPLKSEWWARRQLQHLGERHSAPPQHEDFKYLHKRLKCAGYFSDQAGWLRDPLQSFWNLWAWLFSTH